MCRRGLRLYEHTTTNSNISIFLLSFADVFNITFQFQFKTNALTVLEKTITSNTYFLMEGVATAKKQCIMALHIFIAYHAWFF